MIRSWVNLWKNYKKLTVDEYFYQSERAEQERQKEYWACIRIQSAWKGSKARRNLDILRAGVILIQRRCRKFLYRCRANRERIERARKKRMDFFNREATKIQKMYSKLIVVGEVTLQEKSNPQTT